MTPRRFRTGEMARHRSLFVLTLVCVCVHSSSSQLNPNNQVEEMAASQQAIPGAGTVKPASGALRIGLAPHDRPACQLLPLAAQRRHSAQSPPASLPPPVVDPPGQPATPENSSNSSRDTQTSMTAPNVVSLTQTDSTLGANQKNFASKRLDSSERLRQLRQLLAANNYDAYLVTPNDEHNSEDISEYDRRLRFISGFGGSNGYALILLDKAVLFTDGRYALQADLDLDCNWWLVYSDEPLMDIHMWLKANTPKGIKVATDARLMSLQSFDYLNDHIKQLDSELVLISSDLVDVVWSNGADSDSRKVERDPLFVHPAPFAGNVSWQEKVVRLAEAMNKLQARHYIVSQLDEIAWLLNLRGNDIPESPLFKAYLFVSRISEPAVRSTPISVEQLLAASLGQQTQQQQQQQPLQSPQVLQVQASQTVKVTLYVDLNKVKQPVREHLHTDNGTYLVQSKSTQDAQPVSSTRIQVELKDYDVFIMDIRDKLAAGSRQLQGKLLLNAAANVAIHILARPYEDRLVLTESLVQKMKAVKTEAEVQGMRLAHWRDSLAISMLLAQLDLDIGQRQLINKWTETSAASELEFFRSLMDYNKGLSFPTISAYGSTGAIVHYQPNKQDRRFIGNQSTYLLDSGGQYLDGTTDITRTTHYGEPTEFQREAYTRVLMGAIDMMSVVFEHSERTSYKLNDLLARRHLLEVGLDYKHGTGHGIGLYSLVHEGPHLIQPYTSLGSRESSSKCRQNEPPVHREPPHPQANMFTSVEPGYYKANEFGIRLENIVVTQRVRLPSAERPNDRQESRASERSMLRFEPISLVPFEPRLMKLELMSNKQKAWLNSYNLLVRLRLTQQINYYLSKIRNLPTQPSDASALPAARLMQKAPSNRTDLGAGYYNFVRLDGGLLQEKLELTHRWVMAKTELIPLDVPRSLAQQQVATGKLRHLDNQRLMLAYMSSLPFNDPEAAEAAASLDQSSELAARGLTNGSSEAQPQANRCAGLECDIWLLRQLNQHQHERQQRQQSQQTAHTWTDLADLEVDGASSGTSLGSTLADLFQLNGSSANLPLGLWSMAALCVLVATQLMVVVLLWRHRTCGSSQISSQPAASQQQRLTPV